MKYMKNLPLLLLGLAGMAGGGVMASREIPFNLRRNNNQDALDSANKKIQLAREQNKKKKLDRAAKFVHR